LLLRLLLLRLLLLRLLLLSGMLLVDNRRALLAGLLAFLARLLALGPRGLARCLAVGLRVSQRRCDRGARQEKREDELTHGDTFQMLAADCALDQLSRRLTVSEAYIHLCQ
jgi:hypothetical protein